MPQPPSTPDSILEVKDLHKTFFIGFFRKRVDAVRGVSFRVQRGEIFGLLGPNGAGKTTTIKTVLGLIFPTRGEITLFGEPAGRRELMRRIGYMPENPYVYEYLKPLEFLDLCGRLVGIPRRERRWRSEEMIERIGLSHAIDRPIGKFSKGMTQRIGLAQALLHDPELLILDEPMSGLDPVGRKEVRDVLIEQRQAGKTLIFTSHILSDVETLCDRVTIIRQGKVSDSGRLEDLLRPEHRRMEIELASVSEPLESELRTLAGDALVSLYRAPSRLETGPDAPADGTSDAPTLSQAPPTLHILLEGDDKTPLIIEKALSANARIVAVQPQRETLEKLFVRRAS